MFATPVSVWAALDMAAELMVGPAASGRGPPPSGVVFVDVAAPELSVELLNRRVAGLGPVYPDVLVAVLVAVVLSFDAYADCHCAI